MKGILKHLSLSFLFFSVLLSSILILTQSSVSGFTIYTRITSIELPPEVLFRENYPNHTFFEFWCTLEIINPSGQTLYIYTSTTCLVFIACDLSFEFEYYDGFVWGPSRNCGNLFTNHSIIPGIARGNLPFELAVNDTLDSLPDGNYTIWFFLGDYLEEHYYTNFPSIITVNGTEISITHTGANETFVFPTETPTTPTSTLSFPIMLPCFLAVLTLLSKKRT